MVCSMVAKLDKKLKQDIGEALFSLLFREKEAHVGKFGYLNGGGALFDSFIRNNPDYRPFWCEKQILEHEGAALANKISDTEHVVIVGQGSAFTDKEWNVVKELPNVKKLTFIDLSSQFNDAATKELKANAAQMKSKNVKVEAIDGRYQDITDAKLKSMNKGIDKTAVMCVGSLITNIEGIPNGNYPEHATKQELKALFRLAGNDGYAIFGYDANDEGSVLRKLYDTPELQEFYLNALHYMFKYTDELRIEDVHGNELDKDDRATIDRLFKFVLPTGEFDPDLRNFPHKVKAQEDFKIFGPSTDPDEKERSTDVEAGREFNMMNVYKPRPTRIRTMAKAIGEASKNFTVDSLPGHNHDGIQVDVFKLGPKTNP